MDNAPNSQNLKSLPLGGKVGNLPYANWSDEGLTYKKDDLYKECMAFPIFSVNAQPHRVRHH